METKFQPTRVAARPPARPPGGRSTCRITVKTLEMMIVAAASADVGGYTHLVKVDDDTLVRVTRLRKLIGAAARTDTVIGYVEKPVAPHRKGEFALTDSEWPVGTKFPTWVHGPCYTLTIDVVRWVASSMEVDATLKLEDISASKWLYLRGGVTFVHSHQLNFNDCKVTVGVVWCQAELVFDPRA